jgi:hypothetical protein
MLKEMKKEHAKESSRLKFIRAVNAKKLNLHQEDEPLEKDMIKLGLVKAPRGKITKIADEDDDEPEINHETNETYDYLLDMKVRSMTVKRLARLEKSIAAIEAKIADLEATTPADLWKTDLTNLRKGWETFLKTRKDD